MADFDVNYIGSVNDDVQLTLSGKETKIVKSYEVHQGILVQPGVFALTLGDGESAKEITEKYPANTPFTLSIGGTLRMTGWTDGCRVRQSGQATDITIRGRDSLAKLHDGAIVIEKMFGQDTYYNIVTKALAEVGFTGTVATDNSENRSLMAGIQISAVETELIGAKANVSKAIQAKVGERWYHFVKHQLDRAGMFVWASADGNVVMALPNTNQTPIYRIARQRGVVNNFVNVEEVEFENETTQRCSHAYVYARMGGKKAGRAHAKGVFVDAEMTALLYSRPFVFHDVNISTQQQAEFYASRKIAESRRDGWNLTYTVAGHTVPALSGNGRVVWTPDTIVDVQDDELGIYGPHYIESVTFRSPPTTTTIVLQRLEDLLFGEVEEEE